MQQSIKVKLNHALGHPAFEGKARVLIEIDDNGNIKYDGKFLKLSKNGAKYLRADIKDSLAKRGW